MTLAPDTTISHYRIVRMIGEGGMSRVYEAEHVHLQSRHAIKVLNPELLVHAEVQDRFLEEGRIQARMEHPNIARVLDIVVEPGIAGLVMEYLDGPSIDVYWRQHGGQMGEAGLTSLLKQLLEGIEAAHSKGYVHRDIKPDNVLVVNDAYGAPQIKILDFGIAKVMEREGKSKTRVNATMGTPAYMSPEQIRGAKDVTPAADIWSFGVLLFELVEGKSPFEHDDSLEQQIIIAKGIYPQLTTQSRLFADIIKHTLVIDMAERATGEILLQALEQGAYPHSGPTPEELEAEARSTDVTAARLADLGAHEDNRVRVAVAQNLKSHSVTLDRLLKDDVALVRRYAAKNPNLTAANVETASQHHDVVIRKSMIGHRHLTPDGWERLSRDRDAEVRLAMTDNDAVPLEILERLSEDRESRVRESAIRQLARLPSASADAPIDSKEIVGDGAKFMWVLVPMVFVAVTVIFSVVFSDDDEQASTTVALNPVVTQTPAASPQPAPKEIPPPAETGADVDPIQSLVDELVLVKAGTFMMGSPRSEVERDADETQREVKLTRDFYMMRYEVTQAQYEAVAGTNPSYFFDCGERCPVDSVEWVEAISFANRLSDRMKLTRCYSGAGESLVWRQDCNGFRLPTEAEWEYAARAGETYKYSGSDDPEKVAWFYTTSTHPVGQKNPNAWGFFDMSGNVSEWTWDRYSYNLGTSLVVDPTGDPDGRNRVIRGGSRSGIKKTVRVAFRDHRETKQTGVGFRLVRTAIGALARPALETSLKPQRNQPAPARKPSPPAPRVERSAPQPRLPANASWDREGDGWTCNRGYRREGTGCAAIFIPSNAVLNKAGDGWACNRGYKRSGSSCVAVQIPRDASLNSSGSGWVCKSGFKKQGNQCVRLGLPANAVADPYGDGWVCKRGYQRKGSRCVEINVPANASIDDYGDGWVCNPGYRRRGNQCVR